MPAREENDSAALVVRGGPQQNALKSDRETEILKTIVRVLAREAAREAFDREMGPPEIDETRNLE
jgi:hypothetical protein